MPAFLQFVTGRVSPSTHADLGQASPTAGSMASSHAENGDAAPSSTAWWHPVIHDAASDLVMTVLGEAGVGSDSLPGVRASIARVAGDLADGGAGAATGAGTNAGAGATAGAGAGGAAMAALSRPERQAMSWYANTFPAALLPPECAPPSAAATNTAALLMDDDQRGAMTTGTAAEFVWPGLVPTSSATRGAEYCSALLSVTASLAVVARAAEQLQSLPVAVGGAGAGASSRHPHGRPSNEDRVYVVLRCVCVYDWLCSAVQLVC